LEDSVACAVVAPFRALADPFCLVSSIFLIIFPDLSCVMLNGAADGMRAHCCRECFNRMTRQEKSCRSDEQARGRAL
jgi:hypothetical protein